MPHSRDARKELHTIAAYTQMSFRAVVRARRGRKLHHTTVCALRMAAARVCSTALGTSDGERPKHGTYVFHASSNNSNNNTSSTCSSIVGKVCAPHTMYMLTCKGTKVAQTHAHVDFPCACGRLPMSSGEENSVLHAIVSVEKAELEKLHARDA